MTTTRRRLLLGAGTALAAPAVARAADPAADQAPLGALVAYQQEVVFGYQQTLAKAPLSRQQRATIKRFSVQAAAAAAALRSALKQAGGTPVPQPDPKLAPPPAAPGARPFIRDLVTAEENAVAGFYTGMQDLVDTRHLDGAAALMAQAGRRLVVLRDMAGQSLLPRAFETGGA